MILVLAFLIGSLISYFLYKASVKHGRNIQLYNDWVRTYNTIRNVVNEVSDRRQPIEVEEFIEIMAKMKDKIKEEIYA